MNRWLWKMLLINIFVLPLLVFFPALSLWIAAHHDSTALTVMFFAAPFSCAVWTLIYSQWSSARQWHQMGRLHEWRQDHGGILVTATKATCWMIFGLIGSFACESVFVFVFHFTGARSPGLIAFPLACYAPLLFVWVWRRQ